jgi:hypothetical protein
MTTFTRLLSVGVTVNNMVEMVKPAMGVQEPSDRAYGKHRVTGYMVLIFESYDEFTAWISPLETAVTALMDWQIILTGNLISGSDYYTVTLDISKMRYKTYADQDSDRGSFQVVRLDFQGIYDSGDASTLMMAVKNVTSGYAAT